METKQVTQKGNLLKAKLTITFNEIGKTESPTFVISDVALFQVRVNYVRTSSGGTNTSFVFVRFTKRRDSDDLTYMIYFNSEQLNIVGMTFTSDDGTWHLIHETHNRQFTFDVTVEMGLQSSSFAGLHEDTELTDFELRGEDGSVRMHRAVLAVASPVLRNMLGGAWRESAERSMDVTGTSKVTLEHLKNYLYLHVLPEAEHDLEQLLLLSSYYIMPELERLCAERIVRGISAGNAYDLIEFAIKNNMKRLLFAVLDCVQNGAISVTEIRETTSMRASDASNTVNTLT